MPVTPSLETALAGVSLLTSWSQARARTRSIAFGLAAVAWLTASPRLASAQTADPDAARSDSVAAALDPAVTTAPLPSDSVRTESVVAPPPVTATPSTPPRPPTRLDDLDGWIEYKARIHAVSLPLEARLFYRRAVLAYQSGAASEALRLMRGAARLDPTYLEPHLMLMGWLAFRDVGGVMTEARAIRELVQRDFSAQWTLVAGGVIALVQAWYLALIAAACLILVARQADIRHGIRERLTRWVAPPMATLWSWALLVGPFVAGLGAVLPTVFFLGLGWWRLRWRERSLLLLLVASLVATPWVGDLLTRLATPIRPEASTLPALIALETDADTRAGRAAFAARAATAAGDPYVEFARGWLAQQSGDWAGAEAGYRQALSAWPDDDRVLNDLGHVLVLQGRHAEAIETFQRALKAAPNNATVHFNLSQAYTRSYDFESANAAIARASEIDFDRVSGYKTQPGFEGSLPLVSQWLSPRRMWEAVAASTGEGLPAWPPAWQGRPEALGIPFVALVLMLGVLGVALGATMERALPLHRCSNCSRVVCRRCSVRRNGDPLCSACGHAVAGAESPDFVRMLLARQRQRTDRWPRLARMAAAFTVPGLGLALHHKVFRPLGLLLLIGFGVGLLGDPPYSAHPRFGNADSLVPTLIAVVLFGLAHLLSVTGYLTAAASADARSVAAARATRPAPSRAPRSEDAASGDIEAA